jgi:hypothetical protein
MAVAIKQQQATASNFLLIAIAIAIAIVLNSSFETAKRISRFQTKDRRPVKNLPSASRLLHPAYCLLFTAYLFLFPSLCAQVAPIQPDFTPRVR